MCSSTEWFILFFHSIGVNVTIHTPYNGALDVPVRQVLQVREDVAPGTNIGTVVASDQDSTDVLDYALLDHRG